MKLSEYHAKYASLPDEEIARRVSFKKEELTSVFSKIHPEIKGDIADVAIVGCGERRFVGLHKKMFQDLLGKNINQTTFDIAVGHLEGEEGVAQHDCTEPLPGGPFDITFAHVLLKFIETEKQWDLIRNTYDALKPGGVAVHVLDEGDYTAEGDKLEDGGWSVPLGRWKKNMAEAGIRFVEVPVKYGLAIALKKQ